jgi:esterase/lipase superfamily enzyme
VKTTARWYSQRLHQDIAVVRWGVVGTPVLLFPTAGGDAEEIERFLMIEALEPLLAASRIKVYSCDSVAGKAWLSRDGSDGERSRIQNAFHAFVYHEVVPAIRMDCRDAGLEVVAAGASIGAFNALAVLCRFPDVFKQAICLSGTYNLERFLEGPPNQDFYFSSPLHFLPGLDGAQLEALRKRFVLLASGQGRAEDLGESWRIAHLLGAKGVPNRLDPWGADWHHDWPTWRHMLPQYLDEATRAEAAG